MPTDGAITCHAGLSGSEGDGTVPEGRGRTCGGGECGARIVRSRANHARDGAAADVYGVCARPATGMSATPVPGPRRPVDNRLCGDVGETAGIPAVAAFHDDAHPSESPRRGGTLTPDPRAERLPSLGPQTVS